MRVRRATWIAWESCPPPRGHLTGVTFACVLPGAEGNMLVNKLMGAHVHLVTPQAYKQHGFQVRCGGTPELQHVH